MITVQSLMEEYDLEIADIRWLLATEEVERVLTYKNNPKALAEQYFQGEISSKLYNWDDRFIEELQQDLSRNLTEESHIREVFQKALCLKRERVYGER